MLLHRASLVRILALVTVMAVGAYSPLASAVTVFQNNNSDWTVPANWDSGVPSAAQDGEIPDGFLALGDGLLSDADITIQSGGTLRVTSASQVLSGGAITVEDGARMEYKASSGTLAAHNTVNLLNGASIGRYVSDTTLPDQTTYDDLNIIGVNSEVHVQGTYPGGRSFSFRGALTGDETSTLYGGNLGTSNGTIAILSATGNTFAGQTIVRSSDGITKGIFAVGGLNPLGTGAGGPVLVEDMGIFRMRANTGVTGTGIVNVMTGGRAEIEGSGSSASPSTGNTINLQTGTTIGRGETAGTITFSEDVINLDTGATVTFKGINSSRRLILSGPITADSTSTILVQNDGGNAGRFQFTSTAGSGIDGQIIISGTSENTRGRLGASGTHSLGSGMAGHVVVQNFGTLDILTNAGLQSTTDIVEIQSGGRVEFDASSSTGNRIQMANNTSLGRGGTSPTTSFTSDTIELADNGNFIFNGAIADPRALELNGDISGNNVTITTQNQGRNHEEIRINSAAGNALTGLMKVEGELIETDPTHNPGVFTPFQGVLGLEGASPLGTMNLEIHDLGIVLARAGSLDNQPNVTVLDGGILRFRANSSSTLANSALRGIGVIRSEAASGDEIADLNLQPLTLNNVLVSPGTSAGTLTVQASTLAMNAGSTLEIELGSTSDLLAVEGNLDLTAGPTLSLLPLAGLATGDYIIATYTDSLFGEFGDILTNNLGSFVVGSIDYGVLNPGAITLSIGSVPEPTTGLLALLGLGGLYLRRRKNRV